MSDLKKYLILGATSDLAGTLAKSLADEVSLTLVARSEEKLKSFYGERFDQIECDLTDEIQVKSMIGDLKKSKQKFDGVICTVGSHEVTPLRLYSAEKFRKILDENFFSVASVLRNITPVVNKNASIVLFSSAVTIRGSATVSAYAAAKSAVESITRAAALEFASKNVRVNAIAPGVFRSKMSDKFLTSVNADQLEKIAQSHPLGIGTCEQVSNVAKFLLSDSASWITGQTLVVDGGYSINA